MTFGAIATRRGLPVPSFLAVRFLVAAAVLGVLLIAARQPLWAARGERLRIVVLGIAGYGLEAALFFAAIQRGTAAAVTLLFFTYPVWVLAASLAAGRGMPGSLVVLALALAVAGAAIVVASGGGVAIGAGGVALALAAAFAYALYLAGAEVVLRATNSLTGAAWVSAAAGLGLGLYALASGSGALPHGWRMWWPVLGTAACTAGAFVCLLAGLRRLGSVRTAVVAATEPLAATALAVLFLGQGVGAGVLVGGALILAGAVAASLARGGTPAEPQGP